MKKSVAAVAIVGLLAGSASTVAFADAAKVHVNLNGTVLHESNAHVMPNSRVYLAAEKFADQYGASFAYNEATGALTLNGKTVTDQYGKVHVMNGVVTAPVRALAETLGGSSFAIGWDQAAATANVTILPAGFIQASPAIPKMGEHWLDPKNGAAGPIFGTYNGKLVFFEYGAEKDSSQLDLKGSLGVPIPTSIDHTDLEYTEQGHEGFDKAHTDIHLYFIPRAEQDKIGPAPVPGQ